MDVSQDIADVEVRLVNHAAYVFRDELDPVSGFAASDHMDAMTLDWVVMTADGGWPLILKKPGRLRGMFVYCALAPAKKPGVFVAINKFDFSAAMLMAGVVNDMIATVAPR